MSVKIIYRPVNKNDLEGYLKIRVIENRKPKIKTLGIKIKGKNWNEKKQRVNSREPNYEEHNNQIELALDKINKVSQKSEALQQYNTTILKYYDYIISQTINFGTKTKYKSVRNKFECYLNNIGISDLKFEHLNTKHISQFKTYMQKNGCSNNTTNYNLKGFKALVNKAIKEDIINYTKSPFTLLKIKFDDVGLRTLDAEQVKTILRTNFTEFRKTKSKHPRIQLGEISSIFLFQIFTQGLRCNDVQLLRWNNFSITNNIITIDYIQFKTKKSLQMNLTSIGCKMLNHRLFKIYPNLKEEIEKIESRREEYVENIEKYQLLVDEKEKKRGYKRVFDKYKRLSKQSGFTQGELNNDTIDEASDGLLIMWKSKLEDLNNTVYEKYVTIIQEITTSNQADNFVFHFLKEDEFKNFKSTNNLSKTQNLRIKASRDYYNKLLNEIRKQCGISHKITSHVARHTYTQLLLNNGADLATISASLGHSHISTTQTYIQQLPNLKVKDINKNLSDIFS